MSTSARNVRLINAFTGEKAPDAFFEALEDSDRRLAAELDELHELRTRVAELEESLKVATEGQRLSRCQVNALEIERANLLSDLADLREAHQVTVDKLARYQRRDGRASW
jgi:chromosome segregation ATPase